MKENILPTLYHKGKSGNIYSWTVSCKDDTITTVYGLENGAKTTTEKKVEQKNIGKANETSLAEQAIKEAKAMWKNKIDRKYSRTQAEAQEELKLPMLAEDWEKKKKTITYPVYVQPKLDGVRSLADYENKHVILTSRSGLPWQATPHINSQLKTILPKNTSLDGELYLHGVTFQEITRLVKKNKPESADIEYHVYDIPQYLGKDDYAWKERKAQLEVLLSQSHSIAPNIVLVETHQANSEQEVDLLHDKFVAMGYEGAIVRSAEGKYLYGYRSKDLLKVKKFEDAEFKIIGHTKGVGRYANSVIWMCETEDGKEFNVNPKVSIAEKEQYLKHAKSYIGKKLKVKFFGRSESNTPRFPVGLGIRDKKDMDK